MVEVVIVVLFVVLALSLAYLASGVKSSRNILYLCMAILWMGLGIMAFLMPLLIPNAPSWSIPIGGFALLLVGYDIFRWWTSGEEKPPYRRLLPRSLRRHPKDEPPNPEFQFTEKPPPSINPP